MATFVTLHKNGYTQLIKRKYHIAQFYILLSTALILIGTPVISQISEIEKEAIIKMIEISEEEERTEDSEKKGDSEDSILATSIDNNSLFAGSETHTSRDRTIRANQLEVKTPPPEN